MTKSLFRISVVVATFFIIGCQTLPPAQQESADKVEEQRDLFTTRPSETAPTAKNEVIVLDHHYFKVIYDRKFRLARFVEYTLTEENLKKSKPGMNTGSFRIDPLLIGDKKAIVRPTEYEKSGYDQGHLASSKDFSFSKEANTVTYVMSNIVPQKPNLNRDAWLKLENQVQRWACGEGKVRIITGPILKEGLPTLKGGLSIPQEYFKIVLDETSPRKMLSFIYKQSDKGDMAEERAVSIADLKTKVLPQLAGYETLDFMVYPMSQMREWNAHDCFTKKRRSKFQGS